MTPAMNATASPIYNNSLSVYKTSSPTIASAAAIGTAAGCGPISQYFNQTSEEWNNRQTGQWLDGWWQANLPSFNATPGGFAATFGSQWLGNPDWTCRDDGSAGDCDLNPCGVTALNQAGTNMAPAYYVLESVNRLHSYFNGMGTALQDSAIAAALMKDDWTTTFYTYSGRIDLGILKDMLIVAGAIAGLAAAVLGPLAAPVEEAIAVGVGATLFAAGAAATSLNLVTG